MTTRMIRALLVDDEAPARERLRRLLGAHADVTCVGEATDGAEALAKIEELAPDVVFLDIQMPEMDGLMVAESLSADGPAVVFATAFDEHAIRAFELAAVDYLSKPIKKERLAASLDRIRRRLAAPAPRAENGPTEADVARSLLAHRDRLAPPNRKMSVRSGAKFVVFDVARVAAVVAQDHYAAILVDGKELLSDDSLDRLMERLAPEDAGGSGSSRFVRVHRSAIVNVDFVAELQQEGDRKYVARMQDPAGTRIPISREKLDELKARLGVA